MQTIVTLYLVSLHGLLQVEHGGEDLGELFLDDAEPVLEDGGRDEVGEALHRPDHQLALGEGRPHLGKWFGKMKSIFFGERFCEYSFNKGTNSHNLYQSG